MTTQWIQVKLELGHKASVRAKPTADGFTHDWTVFVRGPEGSNIQHFVERVVFNLHESFHKPKRVVKEPPYQVSESGYAGFLLPIEVYFKSKEEPKKVVYQYDLYLQLHGACNHIRCEQLTFQNPTEDFRRKLIKAGGIGILSSEGGTNPVQKQSPRPSTPTSHSTSQSKVTKHVSEAIKTPKSSSANSSSISTSCAASSTNPPLAPIKDASVKSSTKSNKASNSNSSNEQLSSTATTAKEPKLSSSKDTKDVKDSKSHLKEKSLLKRPLSPLSPISDAGPSKKRKSLVSSSSGTSKSKDSKEKKKSDKVVSKDKEKKEKKEKHKYNGDPSYISGNNNSSSSSNNNSKSLTERKNAGEKVKKEPDSSSKVSKKTSKLPLSTSPSLSSSSASGESKAAKSAKVCQPSPAHVDDAFDDGDASPSSSISFSSLHPSKGSGPLGTLMAELDEQDDDEILSPLSSDSSCLQSSVREEDPLPPPPQLAHVQPTVRKPSPPPPVSKQSAPPTVNKQPSGQLTPDIVEKPKLKEEKVTVKEEKNHSKNKKPKKSHSSKSEKRVSSAQPDPVSKKVNKMPAKELLKSGVEPLAPSGISDDYITELKELQKQIMSLRDRKHLQQIVNVIEETGQYQVTSTTFDFDLCTLDRVTVKKLQSCLATQTVV